MEKTQTDEEQKLPGRDEMVEDMEALEPGLPFEEYGRDSARLRTIIDKLEKEYDAREKVIARILDYGTGIESEKALRMFSTSTLEKWDAALESFRAQELKKK
jgi:hypothetical protein